jgi:hypothetical protein
MGQDQSVEGHAMRPDDRHPSSASSALGLPGEDYRAAIPDTLDLAERGRLAINALTGMADLAYKYEPYHCANLAGHPASMNHTWGGNCTPKVAEALSMMRVMTGSDQNLAVDLRMLDPVVADVENGLWWIKAEGTPWREQTYREDTVWVSMQARLMLVLMDRYRLDGEARWLDLVQGMADALRRIVLFKDGDAYFPDDIYYRTGWKRTELDAAGGSPFAGQWKMGQGNVLRALARWYALSGDAASWDLATRLVKPLLKADLWQPSREPRMVASAEHGHWRGHFHTYTMTVWGLLEYAIMANDVRLKQFVRDFYAYARSFGIPRIGFFPAAVGDHGSIEGAPQPCEGCGVADMVCLAIGLCDAGVGDYWEDVDQYVRNQLVEHQLVRQDVLEAISASGPENTITPGAMTGDDVIRRNVGTFANGSDPTVLYPAWTICCVGNCGVALYRAWEATVRGEAGTARVNLLLNRASPWLDVDSYLPYEGKVVLTNKTARRVHVRIPLWVDKRAVRCHRSGRPLPTTWHDNYLIIDAVEPRDAITIEFPVVRTIENYTEPTYRITYACEFRGNTLIDISPRAADVAITHYGQDDGTTAVIGTPYPIYAREHFRADQAPLVEVMRFVSAVRIEPLRSTSGPRRSTGPANGPQGASA